MRAVRSRGRTSFSHTTRSTPVFLAGDLYTIPEVLAQRADQRAAPRGVPIPGASQVALELAVVMKSVSASCGSVAEKRSVAHFAKTPSAPKWLISRL